MKIEVDQKMKEALLKQIEIDSNMFKLLEINDYSLLLGIHHLEGENEGKALMKENDKEEVRVDQKCDMVLNQDYGEILVMTEDRLDTSFYESI